MHPTADTKELKEEIEKHNHKIIKITNILENRTKVPLPLFFIELQQKDNNKEIYNIKNLLNTIITFEHPYKKRDIAQCTGCQAYGHTKNYCFKSPRCVECAEKYLTSDCPMKQKFKEVKCYNCEGNHPASYKGCEVRKQLQQKLYPKLREKKSDEKFLGTNLNKEQETMTVTDAFQSRPNYAQAVRGNIQKQQQFAEENLDTNNNNNHFVAVTANTEQQINKKLENMIMQLMGKIDTVLNLLTAVIAKMK